jgi:hypothetical protein
MEGQKLGTETLEWKLKAKGKKLQRKNKKLGAGHTTQLRVHVALTSAF